MFLLGGGLSLLLAIALCVHAVRTHQQLYWVWIILVFQPLGGIVYVLAILLPELAGGRAARRMGKATRETLDPARDYRTAKAAYDDSPTVGNAMRLAQAAAARGRYEEAEGLYREAAQGIYADDPSLLLGRANALMELGRPAEALTVLEALDQGDAKARSAQLALAQARAYEGLGRNSEAEASFQWAIERLPGLEAIARHGAFLARTGRREAAQAVLVEIDRRIAKADAMFQKEGRAWRALVADAIG